MGMVYRRKKGTACPHRADTPEILCSRGRREAYAKLLSGLGFADAGLEALGTTMTAAVKFLGAFNLLMGHDIAP